MIMLTVRQDENGGCTALNFATEKSKIVQSPV